VATGVGGCRAIARTGTRSTLTHRVIDEHQSETVHFAVFADEGAYDDALVIGHAMPGW
jgi:hypothetical protein